MLGYLISVFVLVVSGMYWAPRAMRGLERLSHRTSSSEYSLQYSSYKEIIDFLDHYKAVENKRLRVMFDPTLFPLNNNDKYQIVEFWGPFTEWGKEHDVIIFGRYSQRGNEPPKNSPNYKAFLIAREGYAAHVADKGATCISRPCFVRELELPNGGEILVLSKVK